MPFYSILFIICNLKIFNHVLFMPEMVIKCHMICMSHMHMVIVTQWFSILVLGTHRFAHFKVCHPYLPHLIWIISSLDERSINCTECAK